MQEKPKLEPIKAKVDTGMHGKLPVLRAVGNDIGKKGGNRPLNNPFQKLDMDAMSRTIEESKGQPLEKVESLSERKLRLEARREALRKAKEN